MQNRISSFPPIIDKNSEILILGSIPGVKSLEKQQYYGHPQNKFWKIIFELFHEKFTEDYSERINMLKKHHIALWDVIDSCERKGSLDSEIKNEEANQIPELLEEYQNIKAVFSNGGKSYKNLQKILGKDFRLPIHLCHQQVRYILFLLKRNLKIGKRFWNIFKFSISFEKRYICASQINFNEENFFTVVMFFLQVLFFRRSIILIISVTI